MPDFGWNFAGPQLRSIAQHTTHRETPVLLRQPGFVQLDPVYTISMGQVPGQLIGQSFGGS
jgi:hypothetical protein